MKLAGVFLVNQPFFFSFVYPMISVFLSAKIKSRIHMCGGDYKSLLEQFGSDNVPVEAGGNVHLDIMLTETQTNAIRTASFM